MQKIQPKIAPLTFKKQIEIRGKVYWSAELTTMDGLEIIIIPRNYHFEIREDACYFAYEPGMSDGYFSIINGIYVYKKNIFETTPKIIELADKQAIILFDATFFISPEFIKEKNDIAIVVRPPRDKYDGYFSMLWIKNENARERVFRFIYKNFIEANKLEYNNEIIKVFMKKKYKDYDFFIKRIIEPFNHYIKSERDNDLFFY